VPLSKQSSHNSQEFEVRILTSHYLWFQQFIGDGKLILLEHVDHLSVITSSIEVEQLLCVSKLTAGTGEAQASTVIQWLKETEWGIEDQVAALCFKIQLHQIPVTSYHSGACSMFID